MTNFCLISDTHGAHQSIDFSGYGDCEFLIHAGDFTRTTHDQMNETLDFLQWMEDLDFAHKILIAGNHELCIEDDPDWFQSLLPDYPSITYLQDSSVILDGIEFYGSPFSNEFFNWAFMEYDQDLSPIWAKIPESTQVLITHGPAYGINDTVDRVPGLNVGSESLTQRKTQLPNLKLHISGHIHEAYSASPITVNSVDHICPSIMDVHYRPVNKPVIYTYGE